MSSPRPTLFISYASEDRPAVLQLRDALDAAGLDVWYDANELGGGDAWDQKIRRQIRDCDYFMPVISATTERRKEGYFRREWRLAAERTMDMADDVMFLLPAVLDDTSETGARVPEKFLTVQWLRVPGGTPTPALEALARRLATGDHSIPPPGAKEPPLIRTRRASAPRGAPAPADGPPPMPPFPTLGDNHNLGHRVKFFAEVLWWLLAAGWLLFKRAPRWLRIIITIWFVIWGFSVAQCSRPERTPAAPVKTTGNDKADKAEARRVAKAAGEKLAALGQSADNPDAVKHLAEIGSQIARNVAAELKDADNTDKQIVVVPFAMGVTDPAGAKFLGEIFTPLYGRLAVARAGETGITTKPLREVTDAALVALGQKLDATYVLGARLLTEPPPAVPPTPLPGNPAEHGVPGTNTGTAAAGNGAAPAPAAGPGRLVVTLMKTEDASVAWTAEYPVNGGDPAAIAEQIAAGVLAAAK